MKKIALITNVVLLAIVVVACKQSKPEPVVEKYLTHLGRGEFKEIKAYVMEEHHSYYDLLEQMSAGQSNTGEKPQVKVTDIKCDIQGDTVAICSCLMQIGDQSADEQVLQLKKVKTKWLVDQGKETNLFSAEEAPENEPLPDEQIPE